MRLPLLQFLLSWWILSFHSSVPHLLNCKIVLDPCHPPLSRSSIGAGNQNQCPAPLINSLLPDVFGLILFAMADSRIL